MERYKVTIGGEDGGLCSTHRTLALAEKALARLVAMSRGKLTAAAFKIEKAD